jgi:hypothetical protein
LDFGLFITPLAGCNRGLFVDSNRMDFSPGIPGSGDNRKVLVEKNF